MLLLGLPWRVIVTQCFSIGETFQNRTFDFLEKKKKKWMEKSSFTNFYYSLAFQQLIFQQTNATAFASHSCQKLNDFFRVFGFTGTRLLKRFFKKQKKILKKKRFYFFKTNFASDQHRLILFVFQHVTVSFISQRENVRCNFGTTTSLILK